MTTLVARGAEFAAALQAVRSGRGVILVGEAGVGKSSLAAAVGEVMPTTAWVVATAAGRGVPFGALGALLPADLATVHPAVVPGLVATRLRELACGRPVLLAVEDAQHLDDHSAATVLSLVAGGAARLLATLRTGAPTSDAVTALWKDGLVERLDLTPLTREAVKELLVDRLGGEVASGTAELLWSHSHGNPLYLVELARFGTTTGRLRTEAGMWWWHGDTGLPPRLGDLLRRRIAELSPVGRDTLDVLAMGDGLPYETLVAVTSTAGVMDVDEHGVVVGDERDGVLRLRFAHPLLHAAAERRLTPARRRAVSRRLRAVPAAQLQNVGILQRAAWDEASGDEPDVDVLLRAADATMLSDPVRAVRLAQRAAQVDGSVRTALALSAAHSEAGSPVAARSAWQRAAAAMKTDAECVAVALEDISLALWSERDPARAHRRLAAMTAELPPECADDTDSSSALVAVFTARPRLARQLAAGVLARGPAPSPLIRALTAHVAAVCFTDDSVAVLDAVHRLSTALATAPRVAATRSGLAHAFIAQAQFLHSHVELPAMAGSSGRWPAPPLGVVGNSAFGRDPDPGTALVPDVGAAPRWPLLVGMRHHIAGDLPAALAALREAHVQQRSGEGLFRSEASAELVVALAGSGGGEEAAQLLDTAPPDAIACRPGLLPWAQAAVAAAQGAAGTAAQLAMAAAEQALAENLAPLALRYLTDAARFGGRAAAQSACDLLPGEVSGPLAAARVAGLRARASGRPTALLDAAQRHLALDLLGQAGELAQLAGGHPTAGRIRRDVVARLGRAAVDPPLLTRRELQIARMAAGGMADKEVAELLVVSVRTVESHLRAVYRKLDIGSRRELPAALTGVRIS